MADTYAGPLPKPTPETRPFWDAAKQHRLVIQACDDCGRRYFYPRPLCPACLSRRVRWIDASGRAHLHTFVINHRPPRGFPVAGPFVIGIVELEEGPRMMSHIVGVAPDPAALRCDMPLELVFEDLTAEITLPKFRPRAER
jgi:uncharacterized OB-fold protein